MGRTLPHAPELDLCVKDDESAMPQLTYKPSNEIVLGCDLPLTGLMAISSMRRCRTPLRFLYGEPLFFHTICHGSVEPGKLDNDLGIFEEIGLMRYRNFHSTSRFSTPAISFALRRFE